MSYSMPTISFLLLALLPIVLLTTFFSTIRLPPPPPPLSSLSSSAHGTKEVLRTLQPFPPPPPVAEADTKLERLEVGLARSRYSIRRFIRDMNGTSSNAPNSDYYVPKGRAYRNPFAFHRSYREMERVFKVYVYEEGEPPLAHDGPCREIYSTEGRFIYNMEIDTRLRTADPSKAHVFFLPFSITKMVRYVYDRQTRDRSSLQRAVEDYIRVVSGRYPFWNRSLGSDHFFLTCHDWGPYISSLIPDLYENSIRVLCNANTSEGFNPTKDVSLPEMNLKTHETAEIVNWEPLINRPYLAFFAGNLHGPIRPVLLEHWMGKDEDVQVYQTLPKELVYYDMIRKSKFCICPSGYEVASPRVVEAIYLECVPVIISVNYILPFYDVLNWDEFSIQVAVEDIPNLKKILMGISPRRYARMRRKVKVVQRHFVVSTPPKRFDVYHMILHSVWLRRMNLRIPQRQQ